MTNKYDEVVAKNMHLLGYRDNKAAREFACVSNPYECATACDSQSKMLTDVVETLLRTDVECAKKLDKALVFYAQIVEESAVSSLKRLGEYNVTK